MAKDEIVILGIDPGFAITGFGIILKTKDKLNVVNYGCIRTKAKENFSDRIKQIHFDLKKIIDKYKPDIISLESLFFYNNAKTAIDVGQSRGVIILTSVLNKIPVYEYTPLQVKQAVACYGRADKKQVQEMVKIILNLKSIPKPDDAADALAAAICCANSFSKNSVCK